MNILGYSGLHNSVDFKRGELPGLTRNDYRISQGFDSAAALVCDGVVRAAVAEERLTGDKATGAFPRRAIASCLDSAGIGLDDIDYIAHGFSYQASDPEGLDDYGLRRHREVYAPGVQERWWQEAFPGRDWSGRIIPVPHHLAHAASAYYPSGLAEALVVVADGMGETESLTVAVGSRGALDIRQQIPSLHSLGTLYGVFTMYLGFEFNMDEYKVMGLAPYGDRKRYLPDLMSMVRLRDNGSFTIPVLARDRTLVERETHAGVLATLVEQLGPARAQGAPIEQRHMDIAAALQATLETALLHVLRHHQSGTGLRNLCFAGGVALNCTANGVIARSGLFDRVFVPPGAGDDGTAIGAALMAESYRNAQLRPHRMTMPYWGPVAAATDIESAVRAADGFRARQITDSRTLVDDVAQLLAAGEVVAWFQGGLEFGPRALGNRSILADPRDPGMRDHINGMIKQREDFRPFAPVVTVEDASTYFEIRPGTEYQYAHMLFTTRTRAPYRSLLGAVTHVDGTARVQTVDRDDNPLLWQLLNAFKRHTGIPVLLNTSFNLKGQPIVATPQSAIDTALAGGLDRLVLGDYLLTPKN